MLFSRRSETTPVADAHRNACRCWGLRVTQYRYLFLLLLSLYVVCDICAFVPRIDMPSSFPFISCCFFPLDHRMLVGPHCRSDTSCRVRCGYTFSWICWPVLYFTHVACIYDQCMRDVFCLT